jgi:hypothetical protein
MWQDFRVQFGLSSGRAHRGFACSFWALEGVLAVSWLLFWTMGLAKSFS